MVEFVVSLLRWTYRVGRELMVSVSRGIKNRLKNNAVVGGNFSDCVFIDENVLTQ